LGCLIFLALYLQIIKCENPDSDFDNQLKNKTHALPDSGNITYWLGTWFFCIWSRATNTYFARGRNYSDLVATDQGW
jgi:hypothetical protein